jgi:hypothetical protein
MQITEGDTRTDSDLATRIVDRIQPRESARGEDDGELFAPVPRDGAAHETGVTALGDDGDAGGVTGGKDPCDLLGTPGSDDCQSGAGPSVGPVCGEGLHQDRIREHLLRADDDVQFTEKVAHEFILPDSVTTLIFFDKSLAPVIAGIVAVAPAKKSGNRLTFPVTNVKGQ